MKFTHPGAVLTVITKMRQAEETRQRNRALINWLFNGEPPYTDQECAEQGIDVNVNFLDAPRIAHDARGQINNAILKPGNFFSVKVEKGASPPKLMSIGTTITSTINGIMKKSMPYLECWRARIANLVLHGLGPARWRDDYCWKPRAMKLQDLLIPSKTLVGLENLTHFAVYTEYTPGELYRMTHGAKLDPGWNMKLVNAELKEAASKVDYDSSDTTRTADPEEFAEMYKSNLGFFDSDAVPVIKTYDFYFQEEASHKGVWQRRMVSATASDTIKKDNDFLYAPKRVYANHVEEILNIQYADTANVAPFRYHSVRGIGNLLYDICHLMNRTNGRAFEAVMENMNILFKNVTPADEDRLQAVDLGNKGIVPEGLQIVPANDRHQINTAFLLQMQAEGRQKMQENSATFIPQVDDGTAKEMTAYETQVRTNMAASMVTNMLTLLYMYAEPEYREICRRFCKLNSPDPDVQQFRQSCLEQGVPPQFLDSKQWTIEAERAMSSGNKTLESTQVGKLMQARNLYEPTAQRTILHMFTEAMTDDAKLAQTLVPLEEKPPSDAVHMAENDAASCLAGVPVTLREGIEHQDYVESMLRIIATIEQEIEQGGSMATQAQISGLMKMARVTQQHIDLIAQDPNEKQRVKQYADHLGKLMNLVKGYQQRLMQAQKQAAQQNGHDPKAQAEMEKAKNKIQIDQAKHVQKEQQKAQSFALDQQRKNLQAKADAQATIAGERVKAAATDIKTAATIRATKEKSKHAPKPKAGN